MGDKVFSNDICRSMVAMLDDDRSGKLNYDEFRSLWSSISEWKEAFMKFDKNQNGALSGFELREALNTAGYRLNNHILNILMHRFGNKDLELEFDDFMMCAIKLKSMIDVFRTMQANQQNGEKAEFSFEEWIETTLYS